MDKKCKQCNEIKPEIKFSKSGHPFKLKSGEVKQYRKTICIKCDRFNRKDKINATARKYYKEKMKDPKWAQYKRDKERAWGQTEHGKKVKKEYRDEHKSRPEVIAFKKSDEGKALQSKRNKENRRKNDPNGSRAKKRNKLWRINNRETYLKGRKKYEQAPKFKLKKAMRCRLNQVLLKYTSGKKFGSSKYGINWNDIVQHLVNKAKLIGETISSMRNKDYEVDHIIPCCLYNLEDANEVAKCFNKHNLRWLPAIENSEKAGLLRPQDLEIIKALPKEIYPQSIINLLGE